MFSRIGLTGGIGAGKSTIARHFASRGAFVIDYDDIARDVVAPGSEGLRFVVDFLGQEAKSPDGSLNRAWVAQEVFGRPKLLKKLNSITHPLIFAEAEKRETDWLDTALGSSGVGANFGGGVGSGSRYREAGTTRQIVIHEVPLLSETGVSSWFDAVIDVEAPEEVRLRRLVQQRGMDESQARERIAAQAGERQRREIADYVIDSDQPLDRMLADADAVFDAIANK